MTEARIGAVILAGGLARRMGGGDKGLRTVGGQTILGRVIGRMRPQASALVLNANGDPARFARFGLDLIADAVPGSQGPLAGILSGLLWAAEQPGMTALVSVPSDTPFLPPDLVAARDDASADIAYASSGGWNHPVIGLWPLYLAPALRAALARGITKIDAFTAAYACIGVDWPTDPFDPFFNANRPDDLAEADRIAARLDAAGT
jgi:molybdopterin-guanine dinucleotide biosynthesis protein A